MIRLISSMLLICSVSWSQDAMPSLKELNRAAFDRQIRAALTGKPGGQTIKPQFRIKPLSLVKPLLRNMPPKADAACSIPLLEGRVNRNIDPGMGKFHEPPSSGQSGSFDRITKANPAPVCTDWNAK